MLTCLDKIYKEAMRLGITFRPQITLLKDIVWHSFGGNLATTYCVTNFNEGQTGSKLLNSEDSGFNKTTKVMVDLANDLLALADNFMK